MGQGYSLCTKKTIFLNRKRKEITMLKMHKVVIVTTPYLLLDYLLFVTLMMYHQLGINIRLMKVILLVFCLKVNGSHS